MKRAREGAGLPERAVERADRVHQIATEAINTVAYGHGMPNIGEGDEIVLSIMEHHSNIVPWHFIRERQGAKLVFAPVDDDGAFDIDVRGQPDRPHEAGRHHAYVERARHGRGCEGSLPDRA
jgi:cysteine sulfinate desulfinase/cysteine desulfurase-like protein